jgi:hypothetical protein
MKSSLFMQSCCGEIFSTNIHWANYHFTHSTKLKKTDNTTVLPLDGIVYRKIPQKNEIVEGGREKIKNKTSRLRNTPATACKQQPRCKLNIYNTPAI